MTNTDFGTGTDRMKKVVIVVTAAAALCTPAFAKQKPKAQQDPAYNQLQNNFDESQKKYRELVTRLEQTVAEAETRFAQLRTEKANLQKEIEQIQDDIVKLRLTRARREEELQTQEAAVAEAEGRLKELTGRVPQYEQIIGMQTTLKANEARIHELESVCEAGRQEKAALASESKALIQELRETLREKEQQLAAIRGSTSDLESGIKAAEARLADEIEARTGLLERVDALETAARDHARDLAGRDKELAALRDSEERLQQALRGSQVTTADLAEKLRAAEKRSAELEKEHKQLARRAASMESELSEEQDDRKSLQALVRQQDDKVKKLEAELAEALKLKQNAVADAKTSLELLESFLSRQEKLMGELERVRQNLNDPAT